MLGEHRCGRRVFAHRRSDAPGVDRVDPDAVRAEFVGPLIVRAMRVTPVLGRDVVGEVRESPLKAAGGADQDDRPAATLLDQRGAPSP